VTDPGGRSDLEAQIQAIEAGLGESNPQLYRHLALYLQVLRQVLPQRLEQACFHLVTQGQPRRYAALDAPQRRELHRRLGDLVQRCCSLLTVEQLSVLALQMQQEQQRRRQRRQRQLLRDLGGLDDRQGPQTPGAPAEAPPPPPPGSSSQDGSIRLGFSLPLSGGLFGLEAPALSASDASEEGASEGSEDNNANPSPPDLRSAGHRPWHPSDDVDGEGLGKEGHEEEGDGEEERLALEALQELLEGASGALGPELWSQQLEAAAAAETPSQAPAADSPGRSTPLEPEAEAMGRWLTALIEAQAEAADPEQDSASPKEPPFTGQLPRQPLVLQRWLEALEQALARRLRNLSHAVNVELLRLGLIRSLVPVSLLDAVLTGQLESQAAPALVLRVPLPFPGSSPGAGGPTLLATGILVRCTDLEMEEPRLRTCRRRLADQQQQLRRLAQHYRRLQRRQQTLRAERLWIQDRQQQQQSNPGV